ASSKVKVKSSKLLGKYNIENRKYFLYVGNVYPHKNMKRAIEAVVGVNNERNKKSEERIYFVIVSGRGVFRHRLEKQIEKLGAKEYVKILEFIPDEELSVLYKNSLAFVFPSLSEGFGLPGLEALQAGTLLLASDIPVFQEIYKDNAVYFNPKDVESVKKRMVGVVRDVRGVRVKRI